MPNQRNRGYQRKGIRGFNPRGQNSHTNFNEWKRSSSRLWSGRGGSGCWTLRSPAVRILLQSLQIVSFIKRVRRHSLQVIWTAIYISISAKNSVIVFCFFFQTLGAKVLSTFVCGSNYSHFVICRFTPKTNFQKSSSSIFSFKRHTSFEKAFPLVALALLLQNLLFFWSG